MKSTFKYVSAAVLSLFLVSGVAQAHGQMSAEEHQQNQEKHTDRMAKKLELDAAQKQKLSVLMNEMSAMHPEKMSNDNLPMADLIKGDKFDRVGAQKMIDDRIRAVQTSSPKVIDAASAFFDSLSATQKKSVRDMVANGRDFMGGGKGPMGGRGGKGGRHGD